MEYGIWNVQYGDNGVWDKECEVRDTECGIYEIWDMEYEVWDVKCNEVWDVKTKCEM